MPKNTLKNSAQSNARPKAPTRKRVRIEKGSGNVFHDIGVPYSEEALAKAAIARELNRAIAESKLTQAQVGSKLGIPQPRVSELSRSRLSLFLLDKLLEFANGLGIDVEIRMRPAVNPHLKVIAAA